MGQNKAFFVGSPAGRRLMGKMLPKFRQGSNSNITDWLANVVRCLRPQVGINVRHGGFVEHEYCASFSMNGDKAGIILVESYRLSLRVERRVPLLKLRKLHGKLLMKGTSG